MKLISVNFVLEIFGEKLPVPKSFQMFIHVLLVKLDMVLKVQVSKVVLLLVSMVVEAAVVDVAVVEFLLLAPLVHLAQMVCLEMMEPLDNVVMLVVMAQLLLHNHNVIGASIAPQDLQVVLVMLAVKVPTEMLDNLVVLLMVEPVAPQAPLDLLDPVVNLEILDKLEAPDKLVPFEMFPAHKDPPAQLVPLDNPVNLDLLETLDKLDILEMLDHPEMLDKLVPQANQVPMETMAQMENLGLVENVHIVPHHVPHPVIKQYEDDDDRFFPFESHPFIYFPFPTFHFLSLFVYCSFNIKNERYN
jgi:hypothetical protein